MIIKSVAKNNIMQNPEDRDLRNSLSDLFFALGILCEFIVSFSGYLFGGYGEAYIILAGMGFFVLSLLFVTDIKKDWLLFAVLAVFGLLAYKYQGSALILRMILILLAGRNKKARPYIKLFFYGTLIVMLITAVLSLTGFYNSAVSVDIYRHVEETRYTFGFIYPNSFAFFWFRVFAMFIYLYGERLKWWGYILATAVYMGLAYLASSKMCMAAGLLVIILSIAGRLAKTELLLKLYYILGNAFMLFVIGFTYVAMTCYTAYYKDGKPIGFWEPINTTIFTGRLHGAFDTFKELPLTLFGIDKNIITTEMGFVSGLLSQGLVFIVIYITVLFVLFYRLYKQKDVSAMNLVLAGTAYALAESYLPYVNKNPALLAGIGVALTTQIYFGRKQNIVTSSADTEKKKIKLGYADMWSDFNPEDNWFINSLKKDYDVEISEEPDYLICSCFGEKHHKYRDAVKIYFVGENIVPDFNLYDYAMGFHYLDFEDRYMRLPLYALYDQVIDKAVNKHTHSDEYYLNRGFCSCVISNPDGAPTRDQVLTALNEIDEVASGGRYRNNVGGPVKDKLEFTEKYRFALAIENSSQPGYTTEKILEAFAAGAVPIYWGSSRIKEEFNPDSFICVSDYEDMEALKKRIIEIRDNDEEYLRIVKTPIIADDSKAADYFSEEYIRAFLKPIFACDKEKAYRRNMVYYGKKYQNEKSDAAQVLSVVGLYRKGLHTLSKFMKQKNS